MTLRPDTTPIVGLYVVETSSFSDHRGSFTRLFCERELSAAIGERKIVQINQSVTTRIGAIRGMHFQYPPATEMKIVRCLKGRVFDVAVDLRADSPTFLHWFAIELSGENKKMMVIPEGFAHGFQTLEEHCEMLYLHTCFYQPDAEGGVRFDDPALRIEWPLPPQDISARDACHNLISKNFEGIKL